VQKIKGGHIVAIEIKGYFPFTAQKGFEDIGLTYNRFTPA
jgi:hypothetical protein